MKGLILAPIAFIILIGFMTQLADVAMSTSNKVLNYANDMDSAIDCAFRGIDVETCSPDLYATSFEPETKEVIDLNKEILEKYGIDLDEYIKEMNETKNK